MKLAGEMQRREPSRAACCWPDRPLGAAALGVGAAAAAPNCVRERPLELPVCLPVRRASSGFRRASLSRQTRLSVCASALASMFPFAATTTGASNGGQSRRQRQKNNVSASLQTVGLRKYRTQKNTVHNNIHDLHVLLPAAAAAARVPPANCSLHTQP